MQLFRKRLKKAATDYGYGELANGLGYTQPYISQLVKKHPQAWVYFDGITKKPVKIEIITTKTISQKKANT